MKRLNSLSQCRAGLASVFLAAVLFLGMAGCDTAGIEPIDSTVDVGFKTAASSVTSSATQSPGGAARAQTESLVLGGPNGTLTITDLRLIVAELELEGEDEGEDAEFEAPPSLLRLPLNTSEVAPVASGAIPEGRYTEFEFEVEDGQGDDEQEQQQLEELFKTVRTDFPDWPAEASMVAVGTFEPEGGEPQPFTTYFEAEIEIELELSPPLEVTADGLSRSLTVELDPAQWFTEPDGTVWDLSQFDYASTEALVEFEAEFEGGVAEIEIDEGDD